ncbi:palmdelphin [Emydura macquarii macquarii]|uniref:palmdelphin n=1 Tax=Emydura macquarii macquarii TaxID=1129001 RepID=UPI00352A175B
MVSFLLPSPLTCLFLISRMEEAELLKERFQAITDKRKLQEEITQKRLKVEEEKLKYQHLKKKALREKWLLDGVSALTPKEQEEMQKQNKEDQERTNELAQNILRLEKEIAALEKEEMKISVNEEAILKKLKSVERTAEDILKSVKAEKAEIQEEPVDYIYTKIPDLPKSFRPSALKRAGHTGTEDDEENRRALFAMEIKVEKDMKTGESTVLSTIPLPSDEFKSTGVKVYDDGRKSVYATWSNGSVTHNGIDELAPVEVEDLLRKATEKNAKSPTEYHEPVYANQFYRPTTPQKDKLVPEPNLEDTVKKETNELGIHQNESFYNKGSRHHSEENGLDLPKVTLPKSPSPGSQQTEGKLHSPKNRMIHNDERGVLQEDLEPYQKTRENHCEAMFMNSEHTSERPPVTQDADEDVRYSIVQAVPCYVDDTEPVTMIFMGYQHVDDEAAAANKNLSTYDGIIHAELVVIDDDDEDDSKSEGPSYHPVGHYSQVYQPPTKEIAEVPQRIPLDNLGGKMNKSSHKNSIPLQEQEKSLSSPGYHTHLDGQISGDGTENPSLTALRMRMAKLGKKVL